VSQIGAEGSASVNPHELMACGPTRWFGCSVDAVVLPLPDDFRSRKASAGWEPQLEWRHAARVRCGYARDYDY
jgi:hypothetical protein